MHYTQDVQGESAEAVKYIQWTTDDAGGLDDTSPDSNVFTPELLHEQALAACSPGEGIHRTELKSRTLSSTRPTRNT